MTKPSPPAFNDGRSSRVLTTAFAWVGGIMIVLGLATSGAGKLWPPRALPQNVTSPILAIELLRPGVDLDSFLRHGDAVAVTATGLRPRDERETLARAVQLDHAFIVAYALFLVLFGLTTDGGIRRALGGIVILGALAGAIFDFVENSRMLTLLSDASAPSPRDASLLKWWILFLLTACMAPLTINRGAPLLRRWIGYATAVVALAAAAGGIYGLSRGNDQVIETAVARLAAAWGLAYTFVATRYVLRDGLHLALDRLAARPWLRAVSKWPDTDTDEAIGAPLVEPASSS